MEIITLVDQALRTDCPEITSSPSKICDGSSGDDEMRKEVGGEIDKVGLYQLMIYLAVCLPPMLSATYSYGFSFTAGEVDYRCLVPECDNLTSVQLVQPWIYYAAPRKGDKIERCTRYVVRDNISDSKTCTASSFTKMEQTCNAWVYDPNEKTILSEWDITCDENRWKLAMVGTVVYAASFVGTICTGYLSDRFGRMTTMSIITFVAGVCGIIQSFSVNYWMFVCFEFLQSLASSGIFICGFVLAMEIVGEKRRVAGGTLISCCYALGQILLGLAATWLRSWRVILRVFFIPGLFAIFLPLVLPESTRWLIAHGKTSDVEKIYKKMAKINGFEISNEKLIVYKALNTGNAINEDKKGALRSNVLLWQSLSSQILVIRLLACCLCWAISVFVYVGLTLSAVAIGGDKYINFMLLALVEIPADILGCLLMNNVPRKIISSGSYLISGIFCLAIQFIPPKYLMSFKTFRKVVERKRLMCMSMAAIDSASYLPLFMFLGGKFFMTMAYNILTTCAAEMFPTTARLSLVSICSTIGQIGSILAPQTILLTTVMESLPGVLFGCMGILAAVVSLVFPETLGSRLPDTIAEAENIGKAKVEKESTNESL